MRTPFCALQCRCCERPARAAQPGEVLDAYVDDLCPEVATVAACTGSRDVLQLHVGGGCANELSDSQLARLVTAPQRAWRLSAETDPVAECDPRRMGDSQLALLRGFDCVVACVHENNLGRDSQLQYIRALEHDRGTFDLDKADPLLRAGRGAACRTNATWKEPDGIVVVDYDRCIGCRDGMTACPYWARHSNWTEPQIPPAELNRETNDLGNRRHPRGVVEKCHEIRWVLANTACFRLKEELGTEPRFWYFSDDLGSSR